MFLKLLLIVFIIFSCNAPLFAQDGKRYFDLCSDAYQLYYEEKYKDAAKKFSEAFQVLNNQGGVNDRYKAACCWALCNENDSAFTQLFIAAESNDYSDVLFLVSDTDLNPPHTDLLWSNLIKIVTANKRKKEHNLDTTIVAILDTIHFQDQYARLQINRIEKKYGRKSKEMEALWELMSLQDSINLIKVKKILDKKGWLGANEIGEEGNTTLFLVIQHSDQATQEHYLPMMREAVANGKAKAHSLALLEDRVALGKGKKQIYGSQIGRDEKTGAYYVFPVLNPEKLNERRAKMGLVSIEEYLSNWEIKWDVTKHLEQQKNSN